MADPEIYDLFAVPAPDPATVDYQMFETKTDPSILGTQTVQSNTGTIRLLTRDIDSWCLPHDAVLRVKFNLTTAGAAMAATDNFTLCNGGWNIFRDLQINLNGKMIDRVDQPGKVQVMKYYGQASNFFDGATCDNTWFYPETPVRNDYATFDGAAIRQTKFLGNADPYITAGVTPSGVTYPLQARSNASYRKRWKRTQGSATVELWLPLRDVSGFCENIDKVIRGVSFELVLNRETSFDRILQGCRTPAVTPVNAAVADGAALAGGLIVQECSLWMPRLVPSQSIAAHLESQLAASAQSKYMFDQVTVYQSEEYQQAQTNVRWKIVSEAHRPVLALVAFQSVTQYNTQTDLSSSQVPLAAGEVESYDAAGVRAYNTISNSSLFSRLRDITQIEMRVNQRILPVESYRISFTDESCVRAYNDFKKAFAKDDPRHDSIMSFDVWRESPIFAFDLSMIGDDNIYGGIKTNDIELRATVASAAIAGAFPQQATGTGNFQILCALFTEVEMKVDAVNGRIVYVP